MCRVPRPQTWWSRWARMCNAYLLNRHESWRRQPAPLSRSLHVSRAAQITSSRRHVSHNAGHLCCLSRQQFAALCLPHRRQQPAHHHERLDRERQNGRCSPFVTSTDGTNNVIVWAIGSEGDQRLHGLRRRYRQCDLFRRRRQRVDDRHTPFQHGHCCARAHLRRQRQQSLRFYRSCFADRLTNLALLPNGAFQFGFANTPGMNFTVYETPNLATPFNIWTRLGSAVEISSGQFQFTDPAGAGNQERFIALLHP